MIKVTLSSDDLAKYSDAEQRGKIRSEIASNHSDEDEISIVDIDGIEIDRVAGTDNFAVALTDEEVEARHLDDEATKKEAEKLESVIRPLVMKKLRAEARAEVREQLNEGKEAILELRTLKAKMNEEESE